MSRYVLRFSGTPSHHSGEAVLDTTEVVVRAGAKLIDDAPDMLLVEANAGVARTLAHLLPGWQVSPETLAPVPSVPRPVVRTAARGRRR